MKVGILSFPGSNCDRDLYTVLTTFFPEMRTELLWHGNSFPNQYDIIFLPGGFSYGDYLRPGKLANFSFAMNSLQKHIQQGRYVIGICNGFQILCEAEILPGCLIRNKNGRHICCDQTLNFSTCTNPFAQKLTSTELIHLPISHSEGNYFIDHENLQKLQNQNQIFCRYHENPNGSTFDIAGISSPDQRILGMMPHPERSFPMTTYIENLAPEKKSGKLIFSSILYHCAGNP